jgi:L-fucose isomerase-like protein
MMDYTVKIGLVPIRRDVSPRPGIFNWEKAEERGRKAVQYIKSKYTDSNVTFVDLEGINAVSVLYNEEDALKVIDRFQAEKVDAVFLINCNFGNEEVAGQVAYALKKPVLLWAPIDDVFEPDGTRYTDSQCGIFGTSRQLQRRSIPFTYIENCAIEDEIFDKGFKSFISVACMVKNFTGMRIAQVGMRPKPFCSVIYNEAELLKRFDIQVIPVNLTVAQMKLNRILEKNDKELEEGAKFIQSQYEVDDLSLPNLKKIYAFVLMYKEIFHEYNVKAIATECWTAFLVNMGVVPCCALSILADMGYIIGCESDLHGTIAMTFLSSASLGKKKPFFGEFTVRHPSNKNAELLWHCGPFAYSLKKPSSQAKMVNMRPWFQVQDGEYTIARMDQEDGKYYLLNGKFRSTDGPYTFGTYLWAEFDDLSGWERKLVEGPYIHHMAEIEGDYTKEIAEFCKYVKELTPDYVKKNSCTD